MASLWKLPVVYVCENNLYSEYTHYRETTAGSVTARAEAFGLPGASPSTARTCAPSTPPASRRSIERARGRRPGLPRVRDLPPARPPRRRHRPRVLPLARRGGDLARRSRSDRPARGVAARAGPRERGRPRRDRDARARGRRGGCRRSRSPPPTPTTPRSTSMSTPSAATEPGATQRRPRADVRAGHQRGAARGAAPRSDGVRDRRGRRRGGHAVQGPARAGRRVRPGPGDRLADLRGRHHRDRRRRGDDRACARSSTSCSATS